MGLQDELRDAKLSAKTHETVCQSVIAENKELRLALQNIASDAETITCGHLGMKRLAGYAQDALDGKGFIDEFEKDVIIYNLKDALLSLLAEHNLSCNEKLSKTLHKYE